MAGQYRRAALWVTLCAPLCCAGVAQAAAVSGGDYPSRPIRIISPLSSGGSGDAIARTVGEIIGEALGQQVVIDNRPGANGIIGMEIVVRSMPDGYTLLLASGANVAINPAIYGARLPFNVIRDLLPVTEVAAQSFIAHVSPASPAKSVAELIALARARPGAINYASAGTGSTAHMLAALFAGMTQIRVTHVPYKGAPQGRVAVMAHECDFMFDGLLATLPLIKGGRLRGLGVTGVKRSAVAPEIPTIAEAGVPGYSGDAWYGLFAPRGTPPAVTARLNAVIVQSLQTVERRDRLLAQGVEVVGSTQTVFAAYLKAETEKWARVVKDAGIKAD